MNWLLCSFPCRSRWSARTCLRRCCSSRRRWRSFRLPGSSSLRPSSSPRAPVMPFGGLLNATFGNAPELIIALVALKAGYFDMVRASIIGADPRQPAARDGRRLLPRWFALPHAGVQRRRGRLYSSMMLISAISLGVPSAFNRFFSPAGTLHEEKLVNLGTAFVLLARLRPLPDLPSQDPSGVLPECDGEVGRSTRASTARWSLGRADRQPARRVRTGGVDERDPGRRRRRHGTGAGDVAGVHRHRVPGRHRRCGRERFRHRHGAEEQAGPDRRHRHGQQHPDRAVCRPRSRAPERLSSRPSRWSSRSAAPRSARCSWAC